MFFSSWLQKPKPVSTHNRRGPVRYRPTTELLEDRLAPATATLLHSLYPPVDSPTGTQFGDKTATDSGFTVVGMQNAGNGGAAFVYSETTGALRTLVNPSTHGYFGCSVAVSGNTVVVGAWGTHRAHVFNATTGERIVTLANPSPEGGVDFGGSVSISGNTVVVGDSGRGQAYVFNATTGAPIAILANPSPVGGDSFGWEVSVSGNIAVVSAPWNDTVAADSGQAYVFNVTTGERIATLANPAPASGDLFGNSVSVSGNKVVVAEEYSSGGGQAYVFDATTGFRVPITLVNPSPAVNGGFGRSVSVSGNTVVVGASGASGQSGQAYVYNATTGDRILPEVTLDNPSPAPGDRFGYSVSVSGNTVVVGAIGSGLQNVDRGAAYVYTLDSGTVSPLAVSVSDATVTEGNTGTVNATFTVTLSRASTVDVTVHYDTADISAVAGSDYTAASGDVIIPAGQTSRTVTVAVTGDRLGEPTETFAVNLSAPTNATIGDGQGIGTIMDDEPRISISDVIKTEGNGKKTTLFTFTVTLSAAYDQAVTMSYRTVDGTATTSDGDYIAKTGTLTFAPGETTKTITIEVKGDNKTEANETFYLDLFGNSGNSLFTKNRGIGTILNDD